jgi:hypothetical protein
LVAKHCPKLVQLVHAVFLRLKPLPIFTRCAPQQTSTTTPLVVANPGKLIQGIGCTKCPTGQKGPNTYDGTTTAAALLIGPYAPASNTWTGTRCTCTVTATGAAC